MAISVRDLVENIGNEATLKLLEECAGLRVHISPRADTKLALLLGPEAFSGLLKAVENEPGRYVQIPLGRFWRAYHLRKNGMSQRRIALTLGLTENGVYRMLSEKAVPSWMKRAGGKGKGAVE